MSEHIHDEHCDHELDEEIFLLEDEEGNTHEFVITAEFESEGKQYAVLVSRNVEESEDDPDILIFRINEESEDFLEEIVEDDEWKHVLASYEQLFDEQE